MKLTRLLNARLNDGRLLLLTKFGRSYLVQTVCPNSGHIERLCDDTHKNIAFLAYEEELNNDALID